MLSRLTSRVSAVMRVGATLTRMCVRHTQSQGKKKQYVGQVMTVADRLLSSLWVLNAGSKGSEGAEALDPSLLSLRRDVQEHNPSRSESDVREVAKTLHAWLSQSPSSLQAVLSIWAGNGCFCTGYAVEKTMRSCVRHKLISADHMIVYAMHRSDGSVVSSSSAPSDSADLF